MGKLKPINPTKAQIVANSQAAAHDYDNLTHKPQINGHELVGNKSSDDLGLQGKLTAGDNVTIENGVISASGGASVTVSSAAVNQNGTFTITLSDGTTVTSTGAVIESTSNKVTTIDANSTNVEYPSAKAVYDAIQNISPPKTDISSATITLSASSFTYDGTSKAPNVTSVTLNGQLLSVGTDYAVAANPATNAGQYVVTVNGIGDYTGTATTNWTITKAQATITGDDSITISGLDESVSKTYTTNGDGEFSFAISGNVATVTNIGGTVTITPTAYGTANLTVTISEGQNYLGATKTVLVEIVIPATVFGVVWDYSLSSPQLARLTPQTDPLGVVTNVPTQEPTACVGNDGNGQSDFDNYMPWSGMQRYNYVNGQVVGFVDYSNGETFVFIPEFWSKIVNDTTNSKMYIYISDSKLEGFTKHLGSGRYVSRYECNSSFLSVTGSTPKVNTKLGEFRTGITAIDNNHFQYDFPVYSALILLYLCEWANLNSQAMIGAGNSNSGRLLSTGQTDALMYHTGRVGGENTSSAVQYRFIENLWGNIWKFVDGILIQDSVPFLCNRPDKYSDTLTNDYFSTELTLPEGSGWHQTDNCYNNLYLFPATRGGSDSTYTCDYLYTNNGLQGLNVGAMYYSNSRSGLFDWGGNISPTNINEYVGGRSILIIGGES